MPATATKTRKTTIKPDKTQEIRITPPNFAQVLFTIKGTAPYVQNKFSKKAMDMMTATQEAGSLSKKGKKRDAKDFDECYRNAMHVAEDGWCGIPAPAFRNGMISACRIVDFKMTLAKLALFVEADGVDKDDGTPLVKITKGKPHRIDSQVRNASGVCDIRPRPMWDVGWQADVLIAYDADQFSAEEVANLMMRVGRQVGIGEGRPDSKKSAGLGWGLFSIIGKE